MKHLKIREASAKDFDAIWEIFQTVVASEDAFVFPANTSRKIANRYWFNAHTFTYVVEEDGRILGSYILKPNQYGLGNHIANGCYMVHPVARKRGIGKLMGTHSIEEAAKKGFKGIQFNMVVATNQAAVQLWESLGFRIIGTIPEGFRQKGKTLVDTHIMFKAL